MNAKSYLVIFCQIWDFTFTDLWWMWLTMGFTESHVKNLRIG